MRRWMIPAVTPLAGALLTIAASVQLPPGSASEIGNYCATNPYGIDGEISQWDVNDLAYLAYPQTSADMRNRFGSPACMSATFDLYKVAGADTWVGVEFEGYEAIGYRTWAGAE